MLVKLSNGELVDDGHKPVFGLGGYNNYIGQDSGFRSKENDTKVHKQATLSRIDEKCFSEIVNNKDYYEIHDGVRFYNLCLRCGYVPNSKQELYENTKRVYLDVHCKCGNPMTICDWTPEQLDKYYENERENEYQRRIWIKDEEFFNST